MNKRALHDLLNDALDCAIRLRDGKALVCAKITDTNQQGELYRLIGLLREALNTMDGPRPQTRRASVSFQVPITAEAWASAAADIVANKEWRLSDDGGLTSTAVGAHAHWVEWLNKNPRGRVGPDYGHTLIWCADAEKVVLR